MLGFVPLSAAPISSLGLAITVAASAGSFAVTGQEATWDRTNASAVGTYALTGKDAELDPSLFFRCQTGDFYLTGGAASFRRSMASPAGSYQTTGQTAVLRYGQVLEAGGGTLALTGQPLIFRIGVALLPDAGSFLVSGSSAAAAYRLRGDAAALVGSESPTVPLSTVPLSTLGGAETTIGYRLLGYPVGLRASRRSAAGAYIMTGYPVRFIKGPVIRGRGRDQSGPWVVVVDRSGAFVAVRDTSEGLP